MTLDRTHPRRFSRLALLALLAWTAFACALELGRALLTPNWHGLALCLLAVPLLALQRRFRPVALPIALQLGFYLYIYLSARVDTRLYVQTGAARLFFHLVPTALLLLVAWIDGASEGAS